MKNCVYLTRPADQSNAEPTSTNRLLCSRLGGVSYLSNKKIPHPAHFATYCCVLVCYTNSIETLWGRMEASRKTP